MKKAIAAMSGGVDSSVAAYLMREAGYDVTGVTMRLFDNGDIGISSDKTCCSLESIEDACSVANRLGISFAVYDMREEFREEVIRDFIEAYESGRTPNPCVVCNKKLKFERLYELGRADLIKPEGENANIKNFANTADVANPMNRGVVMGFESGDSLYVATGHYAIIEYDEESGRYRLRKALNKEKDQSYVLYNLTQEQLARTVFPLGTLSKAEVRAIAEEQGFVTAQKKESQDICFVPDGDYAGFIRQYSGREYPPGDFVDEDGNVMGEHKGIIKYTIGQRKGLGLALKKPAYVLELDTENNRIILGDNKDLFKRELIAGDFNWVSVAQPSDSFRACARIRYKHKEAPCEVIPIAADGSSIAYDRDNSSDDMISDNKTATSGFATEDDPINKNDAAGNYNDINAAAYGKSDSSDTITLQNIITLNGSTASVNVSSIKGAAGAADNKAGSACPRAASLANPRVKIIFDEPQRAITRGQSVVLYDGDYVLGGGIIE